MGGKTLVIGANSKLGRMLRVQGRFGRGDVWLSRTGPAGGWSAADGAAGLERFMEGVDVVLCLAGATPGAGVDFALNARIAEVVMRAAGAGRHVFLISTMAVYGGAPGPHAENGPVAPEAEYGQSKLRMEQLAVRLAGQTGASLSVLRLGNVIGADMLFGNIAAGRRVTLDRFADGRSPARSYLDPERLGAALCGLIDMARRGVVMPRILNLASDPPLEMADLARAAGVTFDTRDAPDTARPLIAMDLAHAQALLPFLATPVDAVAAVAAWRRVEALA